MDDQLHEGDAPAIVRQFQPVVITVDGDFIADSLVPLIERVVAGQGLAHIPTDLVGRYLQDGRMVTLLEDYEFRYPALHLYYPRENKGHELLRAFVDVLRPAH